MLKFDRLGTSLIDLLHSKHQVLLKSNGLVKKIMLRFFFFTSDFLKNLTLH